MAQQGASGVYARQATGLVREGSPWSVLVYNINFVSIGLMTLFAVLVIPTYPGSNVQASFLLGLLLVLPTSFTFAMLSAAMPRSGGDYVYVSRILGPALGMMSSWNNTVWWVLYGGVPSAFFAYYGLTPFFRALGVISGNAGLVDLGNALSEPTNVFLCGTVLIIAIVAVFALGLNTYFKIQNVLFVVAMVGTALTVVLLLLTGSDAFRAGLEARLGAGAYDAVLASATEGGYATAPFSWYWSLIPMTWIYLELVFNQSSAYIGGEVKRPGRVQLWSMPISAVFSVGVGMLIVAGLGKVVGIDWMGAVSWDAGATVGFATAPTYTELVSYASGNLLLAFVMGLGFIFWSYTWLPGQIANASRNLLAYGIDGTMPSWFGKVNERTHTPVNALVTMGIGSIAALWLYTRPDSPLTTLVGIFGFILSFIVVSIAAIMLPSRQRDLFEGSPVNGRFAGIPHIRIAGALSLVACLVMAWVYLKDPYSGLSLETGTKGFNMLLLNIGIFVSGLVIYLVAKAVQKGRGVDLDATFREIPVE